MVTRGKKIHVRQENPQSHTDSMIGDIKHWVNGHSIKKVKMDVESSSRCGLHIGLIEAHLL
jgi:hypothetical protein